MKYFRFTIALLLLSNSSIAHPGIGIVKDSKGIIYYTDLKNVYKVDPKNMKQTILVPGVHTHELFMDSNDNLYGEHLWYNGEKLDTWGYYAWQLKNNGILDTVIKPSEGFMDNYSFNRDEAGNMYWVQRFTISRFKKKSIDGTVSIIAEGKFKDIRWMHVTRKSEIYFIDLTDLYKIDKDGKIILIARNLHERTSIFEYGSLKHNIFGIWLDNAENIYIAVTGGQVVKKITQDGHITNIAYSSGGWRPTGGLFDDTGNLWLLETRTGPATKARVRRVGAATLSKIPPATTNIVNKSKPVLILATIVLLLCFGIYKFIKKFRKKIIPALT
jgi:hypothetical protein